ncbi:MAG TPA: MobF family relaxase, partial [Guyparkeria sp.]|nr:MobF family relaxase [Guyparkeria sp.]
MMSIKARDAQSAVSYYTHMSQDEAREVDDYYAKEGAGWWYGAGADAIGLSGPVDAQDFRDVAEGFGPDGLALTQNSGKPDRRAGYDATLSAPKSVSVVWGLGDESTRAAIEEAHQNAVRAALDQMQEHALTTRRGSGSWKHERGALVASVFDHGTSREQDMQLHSHCFIHNVAQREDGTWGTIESKYLYQYTKGLGAAYRAELARELQRAGYEVERDRDSFRIASISKDVEREFSKRRQQIEAEMAERGVSGARAAEAATLSTRSRKEERDQDELRQEWRDRAAEFGLTQEHVTADLEHPVDPLDDGLSAEELIEVATANDAVVREQDLFRVAAVEAQTLGLGASDISGMVGEMKQHAVALVDDHGHTIYTSRQLLDAEHEVMAIAQAGRESTAHHVDQANIDAAKARVKEVEGFALADDQAAAVDYLLTESGSVSVIIGDAGTGKSTSMKVFKEAQEMAGRRVLGAAPSGKAASGLEESTSVESQELQKATGIESYTIDALVGRIEK